MALVLATARLALRELEESDLKAVIELLTHPEAMRFWPRPYTHDEAIEWIERHRGRYRADGCGYWMLSLHDGTPIGQAGVLRQEVEGRQEWGLGYILHPDHWRRGYATEAARGCIQWAIENKAADRVIALIRPENEPSIAVAMRLGMIAESSIEFYGFEHTVYRTPPRHSGEER